jgi:nucleotide-binding universal stress UspA family protein
MFDKILVPVDGSKLGKCAVEMAVELARCHGSAVFLLHVIRDLSLPEELMSMIRTGEVNQSRMEIPADSAEIILENARQRFEEAGIAEIKAEYILGDPATKILEYAAENGVDLIVMGHRGLGPTAGLLGGVARKLVNMTPVSVLIAT